MNGFWILSLATHAGEFLLWLEGGNWYGSWYAESHEITNGGAGALGGARENPFAVGQALLPLLRYLGIFLPSPSATSSR